MAAYQSHNGYTAISDGRIHDTDLKVNPLVFVEAKNPCNGTLWIVPGTDRQDPLFYSSPVFDSYRRKHSPHYWLGQYPSA